MIPGSHLGGVIDPVTTECESETSGSAPAGAPPDPLWSSHVAANLKYSLGSATIDHLTLCVGVVASEGPVGSILLFHPNIVHGSASNTSGRNRQLIIITYNSTRNPPVFSKSRRPEFLVARDCKPLEVLGDDCLAQSQKR